MKTLKLPLLLNIITVVSLFALLGCVNRGSHTDIPTPGGDSGAGGHIVPPTDGPMDQEPPPPQDSGPDVIVADNCDIDGGSGDGGDARPPVDAGLPSSCMTMFNFESPGGCGLYGATLGISDNPAAVAGFTNLRHSGVASCGRGSMAVDLDFNLTTRTGGEIILPISQSGTASFTGKTLSLSIMSTVDGGNARFYVYVIAGGLFQQELIVPLTTSWQNLSVALPVPDAGVSSSENVMSIAFEVFGRGTTFDGTLYIDEIDVRNTLRDGGVGDGSGTDAPTDARDGGVGDVRDAPAGS